MNRQRKEAYGQAADARQSTPAVAMVQSLPLAWQAADWMHGFLWQNACRRTACTLTGTSNCGWLGAVKASNPNHGLTASLKPEGPVAIVEPQHTPLISLAQLRAVRLKIIDAMPL
jgi:hypothetical protein